MKTLTTNNMTIKYMEDAWDNKLSKKVQASEAIFVAGATMISIALFVILTRVGHQFGFGEIGMFLGMITMMLSMIFMIAAVEKLTYGKQITGFRFIDWFTSLDEANAEYNISGLVIYDTVNKVSESRRLEQILKSFGCNYTIEYKERHTLDRDTPITVCIDATKNDIVSVVVERA